MLEILIKKEGNHEQRPRRGKIRLACGNDSLIVSRILFPPWFVVSIGLFFSFFVESTRFAKFFSLRFGDKEFFRGYGKRKRR